MHGPSTSSNSSMHMPTRTSPFGVSHHRFALSEKDLQNEPTLTDDPSANSQVMYYNSSSMGRFIKEFLGPAIRSDNLTKDLEILVMDFNRNVLNYAWDLLSDKDVAAFSQGISIHWYADDGVNPLVLTKTHNMFPSKYLLYTEVC